MKPIFSDFFRIDVPEKLTSNAIRKVQVKRRQQIVQPKVLGVQRAHGV